MDVSIEQLKQLEPPPKNAGIGNKILRTLSYYPTKILLLTPFTANHVTVLSILFGLLGIALFSFGKLEYYVAGFFIHFFGRILDYSDGSIARLKKHTSNRGMFIDMAGGIMLQAAFHLSAGYGAYMITSNLIFAYLGAITAILVGIINYLTLLNKLIKIKTQNKETGVAYVGEMRKRGLGVFISLFNHIAAEENIILVLAAFVGFVPYFIMFYFFYNLLRVFLFLFLMSIL